MEEQKKIFIERIGQRIEKMGFPALSGRLFTALLLADPPYMTFEELCECLSASKSSVSTNLKMMMNSGQGIVEYFTLPGDRKRYFRISVHNWLERLNRIPDEFEFSRQSLQDVLTYRQEQQLDEEFTQKLETIFSFYQFIMVKLPALVEEWRQLNNIRIK